MGGEGYSLPNNDALLPVHQPIEPDNRIHLALTHIYYAHLLVVVLGDAPARSTITSG